MAMTAWSANALIRATCSLSNGVGSGRAVRDYTNDLVTLDHRRQKLPSLKSRSRANCCVTGSAAGLPSTGVKLKHLLRHSFAADAGVHQAVAGNMATALELPLNRGRYDESFRPLHTVTIARRVPSNRCKLRTIASNSRLGVGFLIPQATPRRFRSLSGAHAPL